jgi:hypothetical protein
MAGFSRLQSTSIVMQYFMHFAQHTLSGSKMASCGQTGMHARQSVHFSGSIPGRSAVGTLVMGGSEFCNIWASRGVTW